MLLLIFVGIVVDATRTSVWNASMEETDENFGNGNTTGERSNRERWTHSEEKTRRASEKGRRREINRKRWSGREERAQTQKVNDEHEHEKKINQNRIDGGIKRIECRTSAKCTRNLSIFARVCSLVFFCRISFSLVFFSSSRRRLYTITFED